LVKRFVGSVRSAASRAQEYLGWVGVVLVFAAALLLVAVLVGWADAVVSSISIVGLLLLGLAALITFGAIKGGGNLRIVPVANLVGGPQKEAMDRLAAAMPDALHAEIRRIDTLRRLVLEPEIDVLTRQGATRLPKMSGARFEVERSGPDSSGTGRGRAYQRITVTSGTVAQTGYTDVGSVEVAGFTLPIGGLLNLAARSTRRAIVGRLAPSDDGVLAILQFPGGGGRVEAARTSAQLAEAQLVDSLAHELACRLLWDRDRTERTGSVDWRSFGLLIDGLEALASYESSRRVSELDIAEARFMACITDRPAFAAAAHNLGTVHNVRSTLAKRAGRGAEADQLQDAAIAMWERAASIDQVGTESLIRLIEVAIDSERPRRAVEYSRRLQARTPKDPRVLHWIGRGLLYGAVSPALDRMTWNEGLDHLARSRFQLEESARLVRANSPVRRRTDELLAVINLREAQARELTDERDAARARFERSHQIDPDNPDASRGVARLSADRDIGRSILTSTLRRHPENPDVLRDAIEFELNERDRYVDPWFLTNFEPYSARSWLLAAETARSDGDIEAAIGLAGLALALDPFNLEPYYYLRDYRRVVADAVSDVGELTAAVDAYEAVLGILRPDRSFDDVAPELATMATNSSPNGDPFGSQLAGWGVGVRRRGRRRTAGRDSASGRNRRRSTDARGNLRGPSGRWGLRINRRFWAGRADPSGGAR
jgi:tetratricopeptide (TPR) repeat protein